MDLTAPQTGYVFNAAFAPEGAYVDRNWNPEVLFSTLKENPLKYYWTFDFGDYMGRKAAKGGALLAGGYILYSFFKSLR